MLTVQTVLVLCQKLISETFFLLLQPISTKEKNSTSQLAVLEMPADSVSNSLLDMSTPKIFFEYFRYTLQKMVNRQIFTNSL